MGEHMNSIIAYKRMEQEQSMAGMKAIQDGMKSMMERNDKLSTLERNNALINRQGQLTSGPRPGAQADGTTPSAAPDTSVGTAGATAATPGSAGPEDPYFGRSIYDENGELIYEQTIDPNAKLTASDKPLIANTRYNYAIEQQRKKAEEASAPPKSEEIKAAGQAEKMQTANEMLGKVNIKETGWNWAHLIPRKQGVEGEANEKYNAAKRSFTAGILGKDNPSTSDIDNTAAVYFPKKGDSPEVIEAKKILVENKIKEQQTLAGKAATTKTPSTASTSNLQQTTAAPSRDAILAELERRGVK